MDRWCPLTLCSGCANAAFAASSTYVAQDNKDSDFGKVETTTEEMVCSNQGTKPSGNLEGSGQLSRAASSSRSPHSWYRRDLRSYTKDGFFARSAPCVRLEDLGPNGCDQPTL